MSFQKVELQSFRNFKKEEILLENGVNIFYGENAQGKTNFLESLYLFSKGKSFRTLDITHCLNETLEGSLNTVIKSNFLDLNFVNNYLKIELKNDKKTVWLNQKRTISTKISTICPIVLFSPESLSAIKNGPSERRQLIDEFIESLPEFSKSVSQYKKILRARNKVLSDIKKGLKNISQVRQVLEALNDIFLKQALDLIELRLFFLKKFEPYIQDATNFMFGEQTSFSFRYIASKTEIKEYDAQKITENLNLGLKRLYEAELATGYSLVGPHKHEVEFILNGKDSRYYCSQGQQRGLIIAFKIAEVLYRFHVRKERPVLLLDDVMSELDEKKRIRLVDFLKSINSQIVITTTDKSNNMEKSMGPHSQFKIEDGRILNLDK